MISDITQQIITGLVSVMTQMLVNPTINNRLKYNVSTGHLIRTGPPVSPLLVVHKCCNLPIIYCYTILKLLILLCITAKISKRQVWIKWIQLHKYLCAMTSLNSEQHFAHFLMKNICPISKIITFTRTHPS